MDPNYYLQCTYDKATYKKEIKDSKNYLCTSSEDFAEILEWCNSGTASEVNICLIGDNSMVCSTKSPTFKETLNWICTNETHFDRLLKECDQLNK